MIRDWHLAAYDGRLVQLGAATKSAGTAVCVCGRADMTGMWQRGMVVCDPKGRRLLWGLSVEGMEGGQ